jgi:predicted Zn-dependent peptidase
MNSMWNKLAIPMLLLSMTAVAVAQKEAPPEGGPPRAFTVPAHESYTLANGLKVTLVPYGNIPKVTISIQVAAGSIDEGSGHVGTAGIAADLMKEGTEKLTADQLADEAGSMGGALQIFSDYDQTTVALDVLSEFGPQAMRLVSGVLQHPRLPESELDRLKNDRLRQIAVENARAQTIALTRFRKILYGDHPYSIVQPSDADVKKITIGDVKAFVGGNFTPQRTHIYVAGRFDGPALKRAIEKSFKGWPKGSTPRTSNPPTITAHRMLDVSDRPGAPQSTLIVGLPVIPPNNPDALPLSVTNALLGGSFNSRITANIREAKGYTYSPSSQISSRYHDSYWAESADVTTKFTGASLEEIFKEIRRLGSEPPTATELKGIQNYLSGIFILRSSTPGNLIGQLQYVDEQGLGDDYLTKYVTRVNVVTPEEVKRLAGEYLKPESMTVVVVGDTAQISDQLTPFAPLANP